MAKFFHTISVLTVLAVVFLSAVSSAAEKAVNPCSLLTQSEIQEALGKPVQAGTLKTHATPAAGADCNFVVGDFGSFNIVLKPMYTGETPELMRAQFAKMKMNLVDLPNVGDRSFFTSPGFGMTQLQTFKGSKYILFTLLVPGVTEATQQAAAAKLMRKLLTRL
jgi:hypothetical protein